MTNTSTIDSGSRRKPNRDRLGSSGSGAPGTATGSGRGRCWVAASIGLPGRVICWVG